MGESESTDDPRFDEIQEKIDEVRNRMPKTPGLTVPDPDIEPGLPDDEEDTGLPK